MKITETQLINSLFTNEITTSSQKKPIYIKEVITNNSFFVKKIPFELMENWTFDLSKNIYHVSGKFFQICGLQYKPNHNNITQIIINQPEIGILGFITKVENNILYFLIQFKFEPGNIGTVQVSPTVQATKSNYTAVHNGTAVPFLQYFQSKNDIYFDFSLSEQASRFYKKTNRNIICLTKSNLKIQSNFKWVTLKELLTYIKFNNVVNMNARSILSCINFNESGKKYTISEATHYYMSLSKKTYHSYGLDLFVSALDLNITKFDSGDIIKWLKSITIDLKTSIINLIDVKEIFTKKNELFSSNRPEFKIIAIKITAQREVSSWFQPILKDCYIRLHGFIVKKIHGILHFLIQAIQEPGNINGAEIGPTIQGIPLNQIYQSNVPYVKYFLNPRKTDILLSVFQSDEGGRFYKVQNLNTIILVDEKIKCHRNYKWLTLFQIKELIQLGCVNIEARSIISCINFHE